jgi:hypothetical protein
MRERREREVEEAVHQGGEKRHSGQLLVSSLSLGPSFI